MCNITFFIDKKQSFYCSKTNGSGCDASHYTYVPGRGTLDQANGYNFPQMTVINGKPFYGYAYFFTKGS